MHSGSSVKLGRVGPQAPASASAHHRSYVRASSRACARMAGRTLPTASSPSSARSSIPPNLSRALCTVSRQDATSATVAGRSFSGAGARTACVAAVPASIGMNERVARRNGELVDSSGVTAASTPSRSSEVSVSRAASSVSTSRYVRPVGVVSPAEASVQYGISAVRPSVPYFLT
ncbi:hypothetical protein HCN51_46155 [Nonomuraea sp. FMUSA5-5]|uniref:Uncharacterized protein n=1 Tax=Nonomuraea composti TaxID=2720023 RepID=A0ABX1BK92_9ACTN|nr:hypothetical protein [Nonomuraea sp. FMUSA5-5]NJP96732.1 hypothetical protein [Nonomuraea sp. FMUSA5-5]